MSGTELFAQRYELGGLIGYGGVSEVYRARDTRLGRDVAVKVLRAALIDDSAALSRFRSEARNVAVLDYPAIVAIYDSGEIETEAGSLPYLVTEYVSGQTLRRIVMIGGLLERHQALEVMVDVCAALDFAHQRGVVHGDLKPANVMINHAGAVKVMDFGAPGGRNGGDPQVAQSDEALGATGYLSPEQARGEPADERSDVYAAGRILFEMLTGSSPFDGGPGDTVTPRQTWEPRPPSSLNTAIDPELDGIVLTAMATSPENRYRSAAPLRSSLVGLLRPAAAITGAGDASEPVGKDRPDDVDDERRPARRRFAKVGLLVLLGLIVVGGGIWLASVIVGGGPAPVAVPKLVGQPASQATSRLQQLDLNSAKHQVFCQAQADGTRAPCGADQVGTVLRTDPSPGHKLRRNSSVTLYVAAPPQHVSIPDDLHGRTVEAANRELHKLGLQVSPDHETTKVTDQALVGNVVSVDPGAGARVDKGSVVTLSVGKRPAMVDLPDETGQPEEQAGSDLADRGFRVEKKRSASAKPEGTVIGQHPGGGNAPPDSRVTLVISDGSGTTDDVSGDRGPNGRGTYVCTKDKLYFAACNSDTLGDVVQYPPYDNHSG